MRGKASSPRSGVPASLAARLALLENDGVLPAPGRSRRGARRLTYTTPRRRRTRTIGLGLIGAGLGCMTLLALVLGRPEDARIAEAPALPEAARALALWSAPRERSPAAEQAPGDGRPMQFEIALSRGDRGNAPFPLRVTGPAGNGLRILMHNVPEPIWLSRGERRDEHTWALRPSDLPGLHLVLGEGAPDAFEVMIEVVAPPGTHAVSTLARVRIVDAPVAEHMTADAAPAAWPGAETLVRPNTPADGRVGTSSHARTAKAADAELRVTDAHAKAPHWPEGASGLGAAGSRKPSGRQLWWSNPAPAWDPFRDILGH
jgi:hypothetical protein